jgi:uncharacterized membrane protein
MPIERRIPPMRYLLLAAAGIGVGAALLATTPIAAYAQAANCKAAAAEKKLAGAALSSFIKKCQADAKSACEQSAAEKKLSGAARSSFTGKCVRDKVGG